MKKVILFFAVATVVALASCGGGQKPAEQPAEEPIEAVQEVTEDVVEAVDSAAAVVVEEVAK